MLQERGKSPTPGQGLSQINTGIQRPTSPSPFPTAPTFPQPLVVLPPTVRPPSPQPAVVMFSTDFPQQNLPQVVSPAPIPAPAPAPAPIVAQKLSSLQSSTDSIASTALDIAGHVVSSNSTIPAMSISGGGSPSADDCCSGECDCNGCDCSGC